MFVTANWTYAQPGEKSLFTEESGCTPRESTRIQESSQSSLSIKCLPSNYLLFGIVLRMTNLPVCINESGWRDLSGDWWWWQWPHWLIHLIIWHRRRQFGSSTGGPSSWSGATGQVIMHYKGSTAKEMEPCWYCHCMPSASKFPKSACGNGTTTAQMPNVIPPQQSIRAELCNIRLGTGASHQVLSRPEYSTTWGQ